MFVWHQLGAVALDIESTDGGGISLSLVAFGKEIDGIGRPVLSCNPGNEFFHTHFVDARQCIVPILGDIDNSDVRLPS